MPCILTPTNLIGVSRHYTVYPLIVQVNLFCGGGMGLFCERGTSFWKKELPLSRSPPKKAAYVFLSRRAKRAPGRMRLAGNDGAFFARGGLLSGERTPPLALSPQESRLGFPVPPRKARAGTVRFSGNDGLFLREEDFFLEKELPLSRSPPRKPLGVSCPAAQSAPGRMRLPENATKPHPPPPSGGGCGQAVSFGGGPGGTLPFPKGRVPPGVTSPKS